jgi:hypothetical protein
MGLTGGTMTSSIRSTGAGHLGATKMWASAPSFRAGVKARALAGLVLLLDVRLSRI